MVKGATEAPYVDTMLIHKLACQLATLHQRLNRSQNFREIRFKKLLKNRKVPENRVCVLGQIRHHFQCVQCLRSRQPLIMCMGTLTNMCA